LGAATTVGFIIAGQVVMSVVLDQFGLLNLAVQPITLPKIGGGVLVIVGAVLVLHSRLRHLEANQNCSFLCAPNVLQWGSGNVAAGEIWRIVKARTGFIRQRTGKEQAPKQGSAEKKQLE